MFFFFFDQELRWEIGTIAKDTQRDKMPVLEGSVMLPAEFAPDERPIILAEFSVKRYSCSGLNVDNLQVYLSCQPHCFCPVVYGC